jgi:nitrite reductase/ring-hydroxylating ferredoxin subunit
MSNIDHNPLQPNDLICPSNLLAECSSYRFQISYRGKTRNAILIRYNGVVYAYLNQCVHMPKRLDCEQSHIFDESGKFVRCSMHGITYDPGSGLCQSEICARRTLTALKVVEQEASIYLRDKHARLCGA